MQRNLLWMTAGRIVGCIGKKRVLNCIRNEGYAVGLIVRSKRAQLRRILHPPSAQIVET